MPVREVTINQYVDKNGELFRIAKGTYGDIVLTDQDNAVVDGGYVVFDSVQDLREFADWCDREAVRIMKEEEACS